MKPAYAWCCVVLALLAAIVGYGVAAAEVAQVARVLFFVSLLAAAVALIRGIARDQVVHIQEANREQQ